MSTFFLMVIHEFNGYVLTYEFAISGIWKFKCLMEFNGQVDTRVEFQTLQEKWETMTFFKRQER